MSIEAAQALVTLLASLFGGGAIAAIITARSGARRVDVENLATALDALRDENARLLSRVEQLEADNAEQQRTIALLRAQVAEYETEIARLRAELARMQNGRRKAKEPLLS